MKTILITGASSGLGAELSKRILQKGFKVILVARNNEKMIQVCSDFDKSFFEIYSCDVSSKNDVESTLIKILSKNKIDIAILNAGISIEFHFNNFNYEDFDKLFKTNVYGVMNFLPLLINHFKKNKSGKIVTISSLADVRGFPGAGIYSASKAALSTLAESARIELKNTGVEVLNIRPGFIWTPLVESNKYGMPFLMDVKKAGKIIVKAIETKKGEFSFPWQTHFLTKLAKNLPNFIFDKVSNYKKLNT